MFECWVNEMDPPTRLVVDPPLSVLVDLTQAMRNPDDEFRCDRVSMRVKFEGISTKDSATQGLLRAWMQTTAGGWWGLVAFELRTGNGHGRVSIEQWCPARSLRRQPS